MVFCDSVSSHCTRVSRSVRCSRSFRADSAGSFTARTVLIAGRACLNGVSTHLFVNLSGGMHKGTCPGWFARLKHAHACLEWGSLERIPAGTGPSSSRLFATAGFWSHFASTPSLPRHRRVELCRMVQVISWFLCGLIRSLARFSSKSGRYPASGRIPGSASCRHASCFHNLYRLYRHDAGRGVV